MRRVMKQAWIATILSGSLAALTGCMSVAPKAEPTLATTKHRQTPIRTTTRSKIIKQKKIVARKIVKPAEETAPVVVPPLGGSGGGSGGTGTGGGSGGWG